MNQVILVEMSMGGYNIERTIYTQMVLYLCSKENIIVSSNT